MLNPYNVVACNRLRIIHSFIYALNLRHWNPGFIQLFHPIFGRLLGKDLLNYRAQNGTVLNPLGIVDEARIAPESLFRLDEWKEPCPVSLGTNADDEMATFAVVEHIVGNDAGMSVAPPCRHLLGIDIVTADVG